MRKFLLFIFILTLFAFNHKQSFFSDKITTPPGTIQVTEKLFIDECEISNKAWKEFTYYILNVKNLLKSLILIMFDHLKIFQLILYVHHLIFLNQ